MPGNPSLRRALRALAAREESGKGRFVFLRLCPTEEKYLESGFHRKRTGLNHLAFYATSKEDVNRFHKDVLIKNGVACLYENGPYGDDDYYAVFFEDPDRMKLEVVYAPRYCDPSDWTNQFESDFNPYTDEK